MIKWNKRDLINILNCTWHSRYKISYTLFTSSTFISNARLKLEKNQANAKQHPEAELLLFENYSHSSFTLSSRNNRTYSKK